MAKSDIRIRILGQGLAGTALAWRCLEAGVPFEIVDALEPVTASSLAAGLVTPISGQRLHLAPDFQHLHESMQKFYEHVGARLGKKVYHRRPIIRILLSETEGKAWQKRIARPDPAFAAHYQPAPALPSALNRGVDAFSMTRSGMLDVAAYLEGSRRHFNDLGVFRSGAIDPEQFHHEEWQTVLCTGPWLRQSRLFDWLPLRGSQGDILTLSIPDLELPENWIISAQCWLIPLGGGRYRAGSTYFSTTSARGSPSPEGRRQLETRLGRLLRTPFEIEEHRAAVRPVSVDRSVLLGRHPRHPNLAVFTGLSSKGVLTAPSASRWLLSHLIDDEPLPQKHDIGRRSP